VEFARSRPEQIVENFFKKTAQKSLTSGNRSRIIINTKVTHNNKNNNKNKDKMEGENHYV